MNDNKLNAEQSKVLVAGSWKDNDKVVRQSSRKSEVVDSSDNVVSSHSSLLGALRSGSLNS